MGMDTSDLYKSRVLEHNRSPRNFGPLGGATHAACGENPMCGDSIRVELVLQQGLITAMGFQGEACALTVAGASMLSERLPGLDRAGFEALRASFCEALDASETANDSIELGELNALTEVRRYPGRRQCVLLPWAAVAAALDGEPSVSTEPRA